MKFRSLNFVKADSIVRGARGSRFKLDPADESKIKSLKIGDALPFEVSGDKPGQEPPKWGAYTLSKNLAKILPKGQFDVWTSAGKVYVERIKAA